MTEHDATAEIEAFEEGWSASLAGKVAVDTDVDRLTGEVTVCARLSRETFEELTDESLELLGRLIASALRDGARG